MRGACVCSCVCIGGGGGVLAQPLYEDSGSGGAFTCPRPVLQRLRKAIARHAAAAEGV
jgi:hypothetical protein